jgi:flagellar assembly factor FliW
MIKYCSGGIIMVINTKFLGEIEIEEKDIISFKNGLPGFSELHDFVLLPVEGNESLRYMQSIEEVKVCFIVMSPFLIVGDYDIELSNETIEELELEKPEDAYLYSILTVTENIKDITANLAAPIIINTVNNKAVQEILSNSSYAVKHKLFGRE